MKKILILVALLSLTGCAGTNRDIAANVTAGVLIGGVIAADVLAPRPPYRPYYRYDYCNRYGCWY